MTDDIEELLRRYQPAGPPPSLHGGIFRNAGDGRRTWPWVAAAAALLAISLALHAASNRLQSATFENVTETARALEIVELEQALGGGPDARDVAERLVQEREAHRPLKDAAQPVGTAGEQQ
jgi:hypothetical protein